MSMQASKSEVDFSSQHGIWGACASLVLGRIGRGAGVVIGDVRPPKSELFAGWPTKAGFVSG